MGLNILLELVVGAIPIIGDLFDAGWKANARNAELVVRYAKNPNAGRRDFWFLAGLGASLLLGLGLSIYASYEVTIWVFHWVWPARSQ